MTKIKMAMEEFTTIGGKICFLAIIIGIPVMLVIGGFVLINQMLIPLAQLSNRPVQCEQVEVIEKRIRQITKDLTERNSYIVAFKFSDGSVKELKVGYGKNYMSKPRKLYDSIQEGDTGILTYKEIENIEVKYENETDRWLGRHFFSFKKDPSPELDD